MYLRRTKLLLHPLHYTSLPFLLYFPMSTSHADRIPRLSHSLVSEDLVSVYIGQMKCRTPLSHLNLLLPKHSIKLQGSLT